jgi:long-chain acyl-CoA synthetase
MKSPTLEEWQTFRQEAEKIGPETTASIVYAPGETGEQRGAVFDQAQILAALQSMAQWLTFEEKEVAFTLRPWSESSSLISTLYYFVSGVPNALMESPDKTVENMQQTMPTLMFGTPYGYEVFHEECMKLLTELPEGNQKVFQWALAKSKEYRVAGETASPELRQEFQRADMTFFSQFRGQVGGRLRRLYSTGSALPQEITEFFEAIGTPILSIYSLSEVMGFPTFHHAGNYRPDSCGQAAPDFQIRIGTDSEILIRSQMVMREYWQRPEETRQAFEAEGWFSTGDRGYLDAEGYLYITGHKRHVLVLSTGRKVVPAAIESALVASPFITQAAVVGEGKPYLSAMIVPNLEELAGYFKDDGEPVTITTHPRVKALLDQVIGDVNSQLDEWEQVREYNLLEQPLSKEAGEITASMKISRHIVVERYAAQIEAMYPTPLQLEAQNISQVSVDPERLRALLEKETILDAWMADAGIEFLFNLAQEKQIDPPSMVNICDTAAAIAQMESEEKPLSTALIVGDPTLIGRYLSPSQVQLLRHDHIRRMRKILVTMAKMVDGLVRGYVIDKYGYVRGIYRLQSDLKDVGNLMLGPQSRLHAAISKHCDALVFFVPSGGRQVRIFANGELVGRYANGDWSPDNLSGLNQLIRQVANQKGYDFSLIQRVLHCAFDMSEKNLGAIFLIGEAETILRHSDTSEISSFATIASTKIDYLTDQELINFAKQDGATVIDAQGWFKGCMVLLRPGANTPAEIGSGRGARHSSAAKMSAEAGCLAITVSQDGPITLYDSGHKIVSL